MRFTLLVAAFVLAMAGLVSSSLADPMSAPGSTEGPPTNAAAEVLFCPVPPAAAPDASEEARPGLQLVQTQCCKICRKGKACGNSCINRNYTCHQPPGCACDG